MMMSNWWRHKAGRSNQF